MIKLENKRLYKYIVDKDELVSEGRKISQQIELIEVKIKQFEAQEMKITAKVIPPKELTDRGDALAKQMEEMGNELNKIAHQINTSKLDAVPKDIKDAHMELLKKKEGLERERNKVALKVQKIKDKVVPIIQKEVKPLLKDEFDDIETAKPKDGYIAIETFNRLEDWKKQFRKR